MAERLRQGVWGSCFLEDIPNVLTDAFSRYASLTSSVNWPIAAALPFFSAFVQVGGCGEVGL